MRLIDRDRLLTERMKSKYYHLPNGDIAVPMIDIENAPVVDAAPVVRCRDCKYFSSRNYECALNSGEWPSYGYCSKGERRDV